MFSLKKLFGNEGRFYDLLEASATEAKTSIDLLSKYLQTPSRNSGTINIDDFIQSRRKDKRITQEISEALARTFVTPLEREDIEALSFSLYRIPKTVEKIVERLSIYNGRLPTEGMLRQVQLMQKAAEAVDFMVKQLRHGTDIDKVREPQDRLQWAEGEADKVMLALIKDLYNGPYDAKELVILQDFYEMIEKVIDRCRDAGNVVTQIVFKHS
ncbi:putative pit accessory protein [mine drainage metagenome]|uniref:Putative pit accessory protein n=1 Tax=mine drainage metagenome TaxID=410659 RepID=A0A1J5SY89_9ZZZZ